MSGAEDNISRCQRGILAAESAISELYGQRQDQQQTCRTLRSERDVLADEKLQIEQSSRHQRQQAEELQEKLHGIQMTLNETRLRTENLIQRAMDEVGLDLDRYYRTIQEKQQARAAQADADSETPVAEDSEPAADDAAVDQHVEIDPTDLVAVAQEIEDLKTKIERLGNVNLDAIAEQDELQGRADYLNQQAHDLNDSRKQLEELIDRINKQSEAVFRENFERIRENFAELFRKLFGGGKAEIVLENPDDILECAIDIIARPPGKQLQSISLMSGGEKTMTAVALLMAIFKSKPSPFCLLDEVDAALDEANVERFNLVVKDFLNEAQFVIITHSRRTMSIADVIYGVTMQERGVSKRVAVRFADSEQLDALSQAS